MDNQLNSVANDSANVEVAALEPSLNTDTLSDEELTSKAHEAFCEGKRLMICKCYDEAVNKLDEACSLFTKRFGELSYECADPSFYYGKCLLEIERFNQKLVTVNESENQNEASVDDEDSNDEDCEDEGEDSEQNQTNGDATPKLDDQPGTSTDADVDNVPEVEEVDDQDAVAWEILDCARIIYEKHLDSLDPRSEDYKEQNERDVHRLAEIRMLLGEVCEMDEKYDDAVKEFSVALKLLLTVCQPDDRRLAETYFQIAMSSEPTHSYSTALEYIKLALNVLELRKNNLKSMQNVSEEISTEINELDELLTEIGQRANELKDSEIAYEDFKRNKIAEAIKNGQTLAPTSNGTALDINHLVRKSIKRSADDATNDSADSVSNKQFKIEKNSDSNGH